MDLQNLIRRTWLRLESRQNQKTKREYLRWQADNGELKRYQFPHLKCGSVVVDLGGYEGEWSAKLISNYNVRIHIFEPHPKFAEKIVQRFAGVAGIHVHSVALASRNSTFFLTDNDAASTSRSNDASQKCEGVEATYFLDKIGVKSIDLVKINIEGGEYDVLPHFIATGFIRNIDLIQIQFHYFETEDIRRRDDIVHLLSRTHDRTWCYEYIWEEWRRKVGVHISDN